MAKIKGDNGGTTIERMVNFGTDKYEYEQIRVTAYCEGTATPDEVKKIAEVIEKRETKSKKLWRSGDSPPHGTI